jgi:uncharacterized membrane protein
MGVGVNRLRTPLRYVLSAVMVGAGVAHFVIPRSYAAMMPPWLPAPVVLVYLSGVAEIGLGAALAVPRLSRLAGWGLVALFIAVFPANLHHALSGGLHHPDLPEAFADPVGAWVRLPFQLVFIAWAWWSTRPEPPTPGAHTR